VSSPSLNKELCLIIAMSQNLDNSQTSAVSLGQVFTELTTSPDGLSNPEAAKRLGEYGFNEIAEKKKHPFLISPKNGKLIKAQGRLYL
jgi:magnesium-transporting ATPase (P-type)